MKRLAWVPAVFVLVACGGRASASGDNSAAGSAETASVAGAANAAGSSAGVAAPGTGPIDTTDLPTAFPDMLCSGPLSSLHLLLPCKIGMPIGGQSGFSVVECYRADGRTALTFSTSLAQDAGLLGEPVPIPSASWPTPPLASIDVDGKSYSGNLVGSATFEQVDLEGRAFVAHLTRAFIHWTTVGQETDCELDTMKLWATAGDFL